MQTRKFVPIAGLLVLVGIATTLVGCGEGDVSLVVYPDGSGKIVFSCTMATFFMPSELTKEQFEEAKKEVLRGAPFEDFSGIYLNPATVKIEMIDGKIHQYSEFVFEDISQVRDASGKSLGSLIVLENGDLKLTLTPPEDRAHIPSFEG